MLGYDSTFGGKPKLSCLNPRELSEVNINPVNPHPIFHILAPSVQPPKKIFFIFSIFIHPPSQQHQVHFQNTIPSSWPTVADLAHPQPLLPLLLHQLTRSICAMLSTTSIHRLPTLTLWRVLSNCSSLTMILMAVVSPRWSRPPHGRPKQIDGQQASVIYRRLSHHRTWDHLVPRGLPNRQVGDS